MAGKKKRLKLLRIPVDDNLDLIFNQLGVYFGLKLYNPCDDYGK